ncbi:hypothetical protein [Novosphingobium indicum]|uniref:hypothetical protein n=1 Tax=Novosphingobium indicum TaxID=462949 RepID=UPI001667E316|nr:hypothetical protein [Novosphingobium indicum]
MCITPSNLPSYEGRSLTDDETLAYLYVLRAPVQSETGKYEEAISDYKSAMRLHTEVPMPYNNYAWLVATRRFAGRDAHIEPAIAAARYAVSRDPQANYLDTLACSLALDKQFEEAVNVQERAVAEAPWQADFRARLEMFRSPSPKDCTGMS